MAFFGFGKKQEEKKKEERAASQQHAAVAPSAQETAPAQQDAPAQEEKKGLFSRLWNGLSKTRTNVAGRVDELIEATEEIDEDFYEDLVDILIMSDMGVRTSDKVIEELKRRGIDTVTVAQTGCVGMCRLEPIVEVYVKDQEKVTYVHMTPEKVARVVNDHIVNGRPVEEYTIGAQG